ncbi:SET and MYND domain-containing protein 4 [Athalia rosae]|uniref:SET and MYND domain-containing protein 4 n=1 Tax=Athalia rosae TaxID=37344 RepID=UPI002033ADF5|nr:SET and MYND domain-containing protein 4 [Athalia rosae]XP_048505103.1 SET and MYND domain-containing protein 4 [Athalia rosae]XP_048505104.1 SET and MYND domain-containing protein 4 [Athalia rosae]
MTSSEDPDPFYRARCSAETLQSGSKGFFRDFSESVIEVAGATWISKIFGKLETDEDRLRSVFTDQKINGTVLQTLRHVKELYRDKDAGISKAKRLEGLQNMKANRLNRALLLLSQAVLRAPSNGKDKTTDEGFTLTLALIARAEIFMAQKKYRFALEDLKLATAEGEPDWLRAQLYRMMGVCQRNIGEIDKAKVCLELARRFLGPEQVGERLTLLKEIDALKAPVATNVEASKKPGPIVPPQLTGGSNSSFPKLSKLVKIEETEMTGRYAASAEEIRVGDTLAVELPLAACLVPENYGSHCQHCFARLIAPVGCPNCSSVAFCGIKCRDEALATYHKFECKILALLVGSGMSVLSTVALRMITQDGLKKSLETWMELKGKFSGTKPQLETSEETVTKLSKSAKRRQRKKKLKESESLKTPSDHDDPTEPENDDKKCYETVNPIDYLVTHADRRPPEDFLQRSLMAAFLVKCLQRVGFFENPSKLNEPPSDEEIAVGALLLRYLQFLQFNAHEIFETRIGNEHRFRGSKQLYTGVAIYPSVALFNHDCYPAVTRYFVGKSIVIRATRPLKPGEPVAENYGPIFTKRTLMDRQRSLASRYWFRCQCTACKEDWQTFKTLSNDSTRLRCPTEGCSRVLSQPRDPSKMVKCPGCQLKVNLAENLAKLRECEMKYTQGLATMEAERSAEAVDELSKVLNEFHRIAAPPHRDTHLAEIGIAACMADSGNTWKPLQMESYE